MPRHDPSHSPVAGEPAPKRLINGPSPWVHLMPLGEISARDGRLFRLSDPDGVLQAMAELEMELPIDYEHQTDFAPENGQPAPAAGWMTAFDLRADGIWAKVRWTERAREMLLAGEYRFLSPVFSFDPETGEVQLIRRAALTNDPALHLTALARSKGHQGADQQRNFSMDKNTEPQGSGGEGQQPKDAAAPASNPVPAFQEIGLLDHLIDLLELPAESDQATVVAELEARLQVSGADKRHPPGQDPVGQDPAGQHPAGQDPANFVASEDYHALARQLHRLEQEQQQDTACRAVDKAISAGKIIPAQRGWALAYARRDLQGFQSFTESQPAFFTPQSDWIQKPGAAGLTGSDLAVCKALRLTPEHFKQTKESL